MRQGIISRALEAVNLRPRHEQAARAVRVSVIGEKAERGRESRTRGVSNADVVQVAAVAPDAERLVRIIRADVADVIHVIESGAGAIEKHIEGAAAIVLI